MDHSIWHVCNHVRSLTKYLLKLIQAGTLFYQCENQNYWNLQDNIHVFSHPTLEHLIIRHARIHEQAFEFPEKPRATALKTLKFLECDINTDALYDILSLPEALTELTITQLEVPEPPLTEASNLIDDYVLAIEAVSHSLENLNIDFPSLTAKSPMRLRDFDRLTHLELRDYQLYGQAKPRLLSVGLPPSLQTLKFSSQIGEDQEIVELLCLTIDKKEILARKWTKMIVEGAGRPPPEILKVCEKFDGFLIEKRQTRRRLVSSDSVIMEISSPVTEKFDMSDIFQEQHQRSSQK